jgi:pilus assembly protein CpaB
MVLIIIAVLGAIVVFAGVTSYVNNVNSQVGSKVSVVALKKSEAAYSVIRQTDLKSVEVPRRWVDSHAITDPSKVVGQKLAVNVTGGSTLTTDLLVAPTDQTQHERNITIKVDAVTGGATGLHSGDSVDVYAVYADVAGLPKQVRVLVHGVQVVSVSTVQNASSSSNSNGNQNSPSNYIAVTLSLSDDDSLAMTYASSFASEVRVVKLPPVAQQDGTADKTYDASKLGGKAVPEGSK